MPRLSLADVNQMLATVVANSGPDSSEMGDALAQCGLALLLVGNIQPGRVLLRRAAEVKASLLGPGNHIPNICVALSDEPLLWKIC